MRNYFKELIMLFFLIKTTISFNKNILYKNNYVNKYKKTFNNDIYSENYNDIYNILYKNNYINKYKKTFNNDIYSENYNDIYNIFLKNNSLCNSISLSGNNNNICKNCKNFVDNDIFKFNYISNNINVKYDVSGKFIENINNNMGLCSKFTFNNKITGEDYKILAFLCRSNENLCGSIGKYYEEKNL